jgi:PAS domain S-box-containing protein
MTIARERIENASDPDERLRRREIDRVSIYLRTAILVATTGILKYGFESILGSGPPLLVFLPAITISAWMGGLGPGLFATIFSSLICSFFYFIPLGSFRLESPNDRFRFFVFLIEGSLISILMEKMRTAVTLAEWNASEAERYLSALDSSERLLKAMLDKSTAIIFLKDKEGRYLLVNRNFESLLNLSSASILGKTDRDLFSPSVADSFRTHDQEVIESGVSKEWEDEVTLDGSTTTFLTIKFPIVNAEGEVYAVGGVAADITLRKRTEKTLKENEEMFRKLSSCSPLGIYTTDHTGITTYINPRCREILDLPDLIINQKWSQLIRLNDQESVAVDRNERLTNRQDFFAEYQRESPAGRTKWIRERSSPIVSDEGVVVGRVGTIEDITDLRLSHDIIQRERNFAETLIETAQAIVLVLDDAGIVRRVNSFFERLSGSARDEAIGKIWIDSFVAERDRCAAREALDFTKLNPAGYRVEYSIVDLNGASRMIKWAMSSFADREYDQTYVLAIGHDITLLKQSQIRAIESERFAAIAQIAAGFAHEIRSSVQTVRACGEMLAVRLRGKIAELSMIDDILNEMNNIHKLFEDVRNYAAPIRLDRSACLIEDLINEAWARAKPTDAAKHVVLKIEGGSQITVDVDRFRCIQVLRILLEYAVEAGANEIVVSLREEPRGGIDSVRLDVQDDGPGIRRDRLDHIFEPFYSTKHRGTGLGLAVAKRVVETHEGSIEPGPDQTLGGWIVVYLPIQSRSK